MRQAFKCINNEVADNAHNEFNRKADEFHDKTKELAKEFGAEPYCRQYSHGHRWMAGITVPEGQVIESKVWRKADDYYIHGRDFYMPNRRSKAGRELGNRMKSMTTEGYELPGMPTSVIIEERHILTSPGTNRVNGQWYASFGHKLPERTIEGILASGIWESMRPSELMAIYEEEEARIEREAKESEVRDAQGNVARIEG